MNFEDIKTGMIVRISISMCAETQKSFGLTDDMKELRGKEFKVSSIRKDRGIVRIAGFSWHPHDLIDISKKIKKPKKVLFDETLVWI